jgi:hypothetical protein
MPSASLLLGARTKTVPFTERSPPGQTDADAVLLLSQTVPLRGDDEQRSLRILMRPTQHMPIGASWRSKHLPIR